MRRVATHFLRLGPPERFGLAEVLAVDGDYLDPGVLTCRAVLVYATYRATNQFRPIGGVSSAVAADAIEQHCKNA